MPIGTTEPLLAIDQLTTLIYLGAIPLTLISRALHPKHFHHESEGSQLPYSPTIYRSQNRCSAMGDFIRKQIAIPVDKIPEDDRECFCCRTVYGQLQAEGTIEYAVKLECGHFMGSSCLRTWIANSNSCPSCRRQLFPQANQTHDDGADLLETTIGEVEASLLAEFEQFREPTEDEIDEMEATGRSRNGSDGSTDESNSWRVTARRRRADVRSRKLYEAVRLHKIQDGFRGAGELLLPPLELFELTSGVLGAKKDRMLFRHLQIIDAFRVPGMEDEKRMHPSLTDEEFYERLRDAGAYFSIERYGWFKHGVRIAFHGLHPELDQDNHLLLFLEETEFKRLCDQGAFRTLGVCRSFRDVRTLYPGEVLTCPSDYDIWQTMQRQGAHFHTDEKCWMDGVHNPLYGDVPCDEETSSHKVWKNTRTGRLSAEAGANDEVMDYIDNLWLPGGYRGP